MKDKIVSLLAVTFATDALITLLVISLIQVNDKVLLFAICTGILSTGFLVLTRKVLSLIDESGMDS